MSGVEREGAGPEKGRVFQAECAHESKAQGYGCCAVSCSRYMSRPVGMEQEGLGPEC